MERDDRLIRAGGRSHHVIGWGQRLWRGPRLGGKESDAMSFSFDEKTYFGVLLALPLRERYYFSSLGPTAGSVSLTRTNRLRYRALLFELAFVPGPNLRNSSLVRHLATSLQRSC